MGEFEELLGVNPWTALFVLLNTLAVFFVAKKFLFSRVSDMIKSRQEEIDKLYSDADAAKENAEALQKSYEDKLSNARQAGDSIVREATERGQKREEDIIRSANAEAAAILAKANADIAREKAQAVSDAKAELSGIALEIAEKVVEESMDGEKQHQLVDKFIKDLGEQL